MKIYYLEVLTLPEFHNNNNNNNNPNLNMRHNIALTSEQALAYGAVNSGIKMATAYPGSPGTQVVNTLIELARQHELYVEWSSNEKVALEMAIGASMAGRRALVCTKSVGMNVLIDPLMSLNLTGVNGGLVILLGDDPGAYGSQNDQDTRLIAQMVELPMLEPSTPLEGYQMMKEAFELSEKMNTGIVIRITRSFTQQTQSIELPSDLHPNIQQTALRGTDRFVPAPKNAVQKHRALHKRLDGFQNYLNQSDFYRRSGRGTWGIIGVGFVFQKLKDVLGERLPIHLQLLQLNTIFPLPRNVISDFLAGCGQVLILEETEPFVEMQIKALAFEDNIRCSIYGKRSGHVPREGELYRWQIRKALQSIHPDLGTDNNFLPENHEQEIPQKKNNCAGCTYPEIFDVIDDAAQSLGQKPWIIGDPSCLVTVADRLDAKFAIGSAVGIASGLSKADKNERAIAVFGDSSFFHTSLPAICNAVHNESNLIMLVLDNQASATTGFQSNPAVPRNALGQKAPALDMEKIARACGVQTVNTLQLGASRSRLKEMFMEALGNPEQSLLIVETRFKT
jgi:indolepyruvate ferredoxin oxidoreductase alpha subunit